STVLTISEPSAEPYADNLYTQRFLKFDFDPYENPNLQTLRTKYKLDEVIKSGATEFEKQLLLMNWVFAIVDAHFGTPTGDAMGALAILERFFDPQDNFEGHCVQAMQILVSAAASLGWICRGTALQRPSVFSLGYYSNATPHSSTEIWSNQYGKWVMLDPMQNTYITNKEGIPLSAYEIRQEYYYNNDGENLIVYMMHQGVFPNDQQPRIQKARTAAAAAIEARLDLKVYRANGGIVKDGYPAEVFASICYIPNTNFMDADPQYPWSIITRCGTQICSDSEDNTINWLAGAGSVFLIPENPAKDPYFALQQVQVTAQVQDAATITLSFKTFTPNFKYFEIRTDGGAWSENGNTYLWQLDLGEKSLEVRSLNKFGIAGAISKAELSAR
ncbi:MAG: hypothetical protein JW841_01825, partial [Deltaproteobacteria bacterium]|nr:hypothetical protein [Deltaproteobacteria bacterium]